MGDTSRTSDNNCVDLYSSSSNNKHDLSDSIDFGDDGIPMKFIYESNTKPLSSYYKFYEEIHKSRGISYDDYSSLISNSTTIRSFFKSLDEELHETLPGCWLCGHPSFCSEENGDIRLNRKLKDISYESLICVSSSPQSSGRSNSAVSRSKKENSIYEFGDSGDAVFLIPKQHLKTLNNLSTTWYSWDCY